MATSAVKGIVTTDGVTSGRIKAQVSGKIHLSEDNKIALTKLMDKMTQKTTGGNTHSWQTDELASKVDTLAENVDGSETAIDVTNGTLWGKNDVMKVTTTGETMIVSSVSSNTVTVVARSNGATAASAAALSGDQILNLGPHFPMGANLRISASDDTIISKYIPTTLVTNYTSIFRHPVALSRTEMQTELYGEGGKDLPYQRKKKLLEHLRDRNLVRYHGEKSTATGVTTAGGICEFIDSGNVDTTATLTEAAFANALRTMMRYGNSDKKLLLCSRFVASVISEWASVVQRVEPGANHFGVAITRVTTSGGTVDITTDHALEGPTYNKYAVVIDPTEIATASLQKSVLIEHDKPDMIDGAVEEWLCEETYEWGNGLFHGLFNSVTA